MNYRNIGLCTFDEIEQAQEMVNALVANSFFKRLRGLLGHSGLNTFQGLLLEECNAVHTIGMRFSIDIIFLSADFRILAIHSRVPAFSFRRCREASHTLELSAGETAGLRWAVGDALKRA